MKACATLEAIQLPNIWQEQPALVLVDGVPVVELIARQYRQDGATDLRTATLAVATRPSADSGAPVEPAELARWLDGEATLALPVRLVDDQVRWSVLVHGRLARVDTQRSSDQDDLLLELSDRWGTLLDQTISTVWWQTPPPSGASLPAGGTLLFDDTRPAAYEVGQSANRSTQVWKIAGRSIHVFQEDGLAWTVGQVLQSLDALAGLDLSLTLLPAEIGDTPLQHKIDLAKPIGTVLRDLLEPYGLVIQRDLTRLSGRVVERRAVRPIEHGRVVKLAWAGPGVPLGHALKIKTQRPSPAARQWIARADGWLIESTFSLIKAWDPALEGQADTLYSKADNPAFPGYANVYRLWALNEDGRFTTIPYDQGPPFDLTSFFSSVDPVRPRPLRFLPCLTLDDIGTRRSPIVEMSLDEGQSWSVWPGSVVVRTDRAAVYLDDTTLPPEFLSAAQAGTARVRVTGSLQNPVPVQVQRWEGNPFAGTLPPRIMDLRNGFRFQRVSTQSLHFDALVAGDLTAQEIDESAAMHDWLVRQIQREQRGAGERPGRAELTLAGAGSWSLLRPGDRLVNAAASGTDAAGRAEAIAGQGAFAGSILRRWSDGLGQSDRRNPRGTSRAPSTLVELRF